MGIKVLEIGGNSKKQAQYVPGWENAEILNLDIDPAQNPDILADAASIPQEYHGVFDGILASHVLEHFSYRITERVLRNWMDCLKDGGALHVVVPSWEWLAREVLSENPSPACYGHGFGGHVNAWDCHYAMFTMRKLRQLFDKIGLSVTHAKTGVYHIRVGDKEYEAEQHYICGVKGTPPLAKE